MDAVIWLEAPHVACRIDRRRRPLLDQRNLRVPAARARRPRRHHRQVPEQRSRLPQRLLVPRRQEVRPRCVSDWRGEVRDVRPAPASAGCSATSTRTWPPMSSSVDSPYFAASDATRRLRIHGHRPVATRITRGAPVASRDDRGQSASATATPFDSPVAVKLASRPCAGDLLHHVDRGRPGRDRRGRRAPVGAVHRRCRGCGATQARVFGEVPLFRFFAEGTWTARAIRMVARAKRSRPPIRTRGRRAPWTPTLERRSIGDGRVFGSVRAGRFRTPFGIYAASDHAYNGFLRAPLIRYERVLVADQHASSSTA